MASIAFLFFQEAMISQPYSLLSVSPLKLMLILSRHPTAPFVFFAFTSHQLRESEFRDRRGDPTYPACVFFQHEELCVCAVFD